ncbi:unnamed protein product [Phytomonas sp. EM1]|nr:unnamed protein product [Phytomonas sp. EM1]|eukprot:CCW59789.1 unnamed protein product [Phytomonas sp. isolate EM1]
MHRAPPGLPSEGKKTELEGPPTEIPDGIVPHHRGDHPIRKVVEVKTREHGEMTGGRRELSLKLADGKRKKHREGAGDAQRVRPLQPRGGEAGVELRARDDAGDHERVGDVHEEGNEPQGGVDVFHPFPLGRLDLLDERPHGVRGKRRNGVDMHLQRACQRRHARVDAGGEQHKDVLVFREDLQRRLGVFDVV